MGFKYVHKGNIPDSDPNWYGEHVKCCHNCDNCDISLDMIASLNYGDSDMINHCWCKLFNDTVYWDWYCDDYKEIEKEDNELYKVEFVEE